jgi:hypothetical protein
LWLLCGILLGAKKIKKIVVSNPSGHGWGCLVHK